MRRTDWAGWHHVYEDPESRFSKRLRLVQAHLRVVLDQHAPGPIRIVVPCAGQGRDVLGALAQHRRRGDVTLTLVELDPQNAEFARSAAQDLGIGSVQVVEGDAGRTDAYSGAVPASVIVLVGFFVYLSSRDLSRLIRHLPELCDHGAVAVWVRGTVADKHSPDSIRDRFERAGFRPVATHLESPWDFHVGVERFEGTPVPLRPGVRVFSFRDPMRLTHHTFRRARNRVARTLRRRSR